MRRHVLLIAIFPLNIDLTHFYFVRRLQRRQLVVFYARRCLIMPKLASLTEVYGAHALFTVSFPIWQIAARDGLVPAATINAGPLMDRLTLVESLRLTKLITLLHQIGVQARRAGVHLLNTNITRKLFAALVAIQVTDRGLLCQLPSISLVDVARNLLGVVLIV